jgi:integrase
MREEQRRQAVQVENARLVPQGGGTIAVSTIVRGRTHAIHCAVGRLRSASPATLSSVHQGRAPRNKGQRYPADPPTVEEIIAVMHAAGHDNDAIRLRGLIVVLWRAGLRISEALTLNECDLDLNRGAILVRFGKGGKRREVGMDRWAWEQLSPWLQVRATLPVGALFCVLRGPTAGRAWRPPVGRGLMDASFGSWRIGSGRS